MLLSSIIVLAGLAAAKPVPNTEVAVFAGVARGTDASNELAKRFECTTVDAIIDAMGTSKSKLIYTVSARVTALEVCQYLVRRGYLGVTTEDCYGAANIITAGFATVFALTGSWSVAEPNEPIDKRALLLADHLHSIFSNNDVGSNYSHSGVHALEPEQSGDENVPMLHHAIVTGFTHGNMTADLVFADFGEGRGHIRIQAPGDFAPAASVNGTAKLVRRDHTGPGFKMVYTSRLKSLLSQQHQLDSSAALSHDWANRANTQGIGDYTGFQETDHTSNFYYRIIAEDGSFGSNYESVDTPCGGMAWAL